MRYNPKALREGKLVTFVEDEVVVYSLDDHQAACLDATAAAVWELCDGDRDLDDILIACKARDKAREETLETLDRLADAELITGYFHQEAVDTGRRDALLRIAGIGAGSVAVMTVPVAAQTASCLANGSPCTTNSQCCSGVCGNGGRCNR